jgi:AraC-like DNA-binding protein
MIHRAPCDEIVSLPLRSADGYMQAFETMKALLTEGTEKIGAVAEACGFSSPYHFCRIFREKTGLTPTAYRQQNRIYTI